MEETPHFKGEFVKWFMTNPYSYIKNCDHHTRCAIHISSITWTLSQFQQFSLMPLIMLMITKHATNCLWFLRMAEFAQHFEKTHLLYTVVADFTVGC